MELGFKSKVDIIVPVFNEAGNILPFLLSLKRNVKAPFKVLICFDFDEDTTLTAIRNAKHLLQDLTIELVRNSGRGPHSAVISGFKAAHAPMLLVMPADDVLNAGIIDRMCDQIEDGASIVCASRLMPGGSMKDCPLLKAFLVRATGYTLRLLARLPTRDATNGFRMFSSTFIRSVTIESTRGFTYSIELLVKCHRMRGKIVEIPAGWRERDAGKSRFQVWRWALPYLRWYFYALVTPFTRLFPTVQPQNAILTNRSEAEGVTWKE